MEAMEEKWSDNQDSDKKKSECDAELHYPLTFDNSLTAPDPQSISPESLLLCSPSRRWSEWMWQQKARQHFLLTLIIWIWRMKGVCRIYCAP